MKSLRLVAVAVAAVLALAGVTGCGTVPGARGDVIQVVAGENVWGDVVSQVGGARVEVTSIINDPGDDPHEYESSDRNAIAVATARLVVRNGLGYDDFLPKLVAASGAHPTMLTVADVLGVRGADANPHLWYDAARLPTVADAIATELGELDPVHRAEFAANAKAFEASLNPLLGVIDQIRSEFAGTAIAYTERVPGYLVEAAGLRLGVPASFPQAVEEGQDPSPHDTVAFNDALKTRAVKALLYNAQVADAQTTEIKQLAADSGVPIVGMTETMPTSYRHLQDWQLAQATALLEALRKAAR